MNARRVILDAGCTEMERRVALTKEDGSLPEGHELEILISAASRPVATLLEELRSSMQDLFRKLRMSTWTLLSSIDVCVFD